MSNNVQLIRDAYDCFGRGDIPTLLGMMDPNMQWSEAEGNPYQPSGEPWHGPDAVLQNLFVKIGADFDGTFVVHTHNQNPQALRGQLGAVGDVDRWQDEA